MPRSDTEEPMRARVPADVERKDAILFGFTFRQLVILTVAGLLIYTAWTALAETVPPLGLLVGAIPVAGAAFVLAVGRRDGIPLDAWLWHALRYRRAPRRLAPTAGPVTPAPAWVQTSSGRGDQLPLPAPLRLPAKGITADGLVDLGPDGTTALVTASTVNLGLRSPGEQNSLVAGFGRWLNSLDAPVQIVVRARRIDLTMVADRIHELAPSLPHPALEQAALSHVAFLDDLATQRELLHRQVTLAIRDHRGAGHTLHRAAETVRALAACEVTATVLDSGDAAATLAGCLDPTGPPPPVGLAPDGAVIHATPGAGGTSAAGGEWW
ncbi:MAG: PrgI family protein [Micromonosporaceae bacterium]|nr:PrgI family protein [Micromonosporaceae bacterium]